METDMLVNIPTSIELHSNTVPKSGRRVNSVEIADV